MLQARGSNGNQMWPRWAPGEPAAGLGHRMQLPAQAAERGRAAPQQQAARCRQMPEDPQPAETGSPVPASSSATAIPKMPRRPVVRDPEGPTAAQQTTRFPPEADLLHPNCRIRATQHETLRRLLTTLICCSGEPRHSPGPSKGDSFCQPSSPQEGRREHGLFLQAPGETVLPRGFVGGTDASQGLSKPRDRDSNNLRATHLPPPAGWPGKDPGHVQPSCRPFGTFSFVDHGRWEDRGSYLGQTPLGHRRQKAPATHRQTALIPLRGLPVKGMPGRQPGKSRSKWGIYLQGRRVRTHGHIISVNA